MQNLSTVLHRNGDIIDFFPGVRNITKVNAKDLANRERYYRMNWNIYRRLSGAACELWDNRKYKPIFLTITSKDPIDENKSNSLLSNFLKNLYANYNLSGHIWVREHQERGAIHYHSVLDIAYHDIRDLNNSWCYTIRDYSRPSNNALSLSKKWGGVVKSRKSVIRYVCKYISKGYGTRSKQRIYGYSQWLNKKPLPLDPYTREDILTNYWRYTFKHEYGAIYFTKQNRNLYDTVRKRLDY